MSRIFAPFITGIAVISSIAWADTAWAQANFTDVSESYWAKPFIEALAKKDIIKGFPDGSFRPNEPVTRAQFAALLKNAFSPAATRTSRTFADVPSAYWATSAIDKAYTTGFLSGYPNGTFAPEQKIPKVQALVSLASGLNLSPVGSVENTLKRFGDQAQIPAYARPGVAAATQRRIPVNYPTVGNLSPNQSASRADIAAYLYQSLVDQGKIRPIASNLPASQYIVLGGVGTTPSKQSLAAGTAIPVVIPGGIPDSNLVMAVGESFETTFEVSQDIANPQKEVMIPKGSKISGVFKPQAESGASAKFFAETVMIGNNRFDLDATSVAFSARKKNSLTVQDISGGISTIAAATVLDSLFNRIGNATGVDNKVLGTAKRGLNVGSLLPTIIQTGQTLSQKATSQDDVILVEPDQLGLTLDAEFRYAPATTTPVTQTPVNPSPFKLAKGSSMGLVAQNTGAKYVVLPGETFPVEVKIAETVYNATNQVLVPQGSLVRGSLKPNANSSAVFEATELVIDGRTFPLNAMSATIPGTDVSSLNLSSLSGNVVASPQASEALRQRTSGGSGSGGILGSLLGGAGSTKAQVIIFDPAATPLKLNSDLVFLEGEG
jgi:hypothetical protein